MDGSTGRGLGGANVVLAGTLKGGVTDGDGFFSIGSLRDGEYQLRVMIDGFDPYDQKVRIKGEEVRLNVRLDRDVDWKVAGPGYRLVTPAPRTAFSARLAAPANEQVVGSPGIAPDYLLACAEAPGIHYLVAGGRLGAPSVRGFAGDRVAMYDGVRTRMAHGLPGIGWDLPSSEIHAGPLYRATPGPFFFSPATGGFATAASPSAASGSPRGSRPATAVADLGYRSNLSAWRSRLQLGGEIVSETMPDQGGVSKGTSKLAASSSPESSSV